MGDHIIFIIICILLLIPAVGLSYILAQKIEDPSQKKYQDLTLSVNTSLAPIWVGLVAIMIFAGSQNYSIASLGTCIAIAIASMIVGSLFGFLFGVPKTTKNPENSGSVEIEDGDIDSKEAIKNNHRFYTDNTNIEEISDWLTKMIVGIGLIQLYKVSDYLGLLRDQLSGLPIAAEGNLYGGTFGVVIVIIYLTSGFFLGYLSTRLFLPGAFSRVNQLVDEINAKNVEIEGLTVTDAKLKQAISGNEQVFPDDLKKKELDLLNKIYDNDKSEHKLNLGSLIPEFKRHTELHRILGSLRSKGLISSTEGGSWRYYKHPELTSFGELFLQHRQKKSTEDDMV